LRAAAPAVVVALSSIGAAAEPGLRPIDQGPAWTPEARTKFYSQDQGSLVIPLRWITVLKQPNGTPFMADGLTRYGYLPHEASKAGLPVGFTAVSRRGQVVMGMTCAACHTRQIEVAGPPIASMAVRRSSTSRASSAISMLRSMRC
jgi:hypothetical protein